jgi:CheY-like chemotaxis protein
METLTKMPPAVVLVVDDEPMVRMLGADILEGAGYRVIEAADAAEALRVLEGAGGVSLLFTDVNMPGDLDGLDLARTVRKRWPDIRLLIVSGKEHPTGKELPIAGRFMLKPYDVENLLTQVRELLAQPPPPVRRWG